MPFIRPSPNPIYKCHDQHDITLLTRLRVGFSNDSNVKIRGFNYIDKPRTNGAGGGVGVYISERIQFIRRYDLENNLIECIWLEISYPNTKSFLIGIIYRPPDTSLYLPANFNMLLNEVLSLICSEDKEITLLGDMNCNKKPRALRFALQSMRKRTKRTCHRFCLISTLTEVISV